MAGFKNIETLIEQALDKGVPIEAVAEYFGLSRSEVVECARRRRIVKWEEAEIAKRREALGQRMKEEQAACGRKAPSPRSEHEYALLRGLANIGKVSAASRALGRSPDDIHKAMKELDRRAAVLRERKRIAAENREARYQRRKEEALEANWGNAPVIKAHREQYQKWLGGLDEIVINGKNYTRLLDQAMRIVRARIEIVAAIGK